MEPLVHPVIERLRAKRQKPMGERLTLSDAETMPLASVLDQGFEPPPALRETLANLANPKRRPPKLRWKKPAV